MRILAIDQGTTGTTARVFDRDGAVLATAYREIRQIYPRPGWVGHDPVDIWTSVRETAGEVLDTAGAGIDAVGITNQRETTVVWNRETGEPVADAIVWQCRRTADFCESIRDREPLLRRKTGLPVDAYFSGSKIRWLLDNTDYRDVGDLAFGTVDSWLVWKLTGGERHVTDFTNASRTQLFDIGAREWDDELLDIFGVPHSLLPEVLHSTAHFGDITTIPGLAGVPVHGIAGDQQAALFGQACFNPGEVKNTYGTGSFLVMNTGGEFVRSERGLLSTLAVNSAGEPCHALEGPVFVSGAAIQWLRDELGIIGSAEESEPLARSVADTGGVYLVPGFSGLGAPHWRMDARGTLTGLTRGSGCAHIVRAALESMAYQTCDVLDAMNAETDVPVAELRADGGAVANGFLMQFQADILGIPVKVPDNTESTSMGAAMLAGIGAGIWKDAGDLRDLKNYRRIYEPSMSGDERNRLLDGWRRAVRQTLTR